MRKLFRSFQFAFQGLQYALETQRNMRIHSVSAVAAIALGLFLDIEVRDWLPLLTAIFMVLMAEMLNTAIEATVNLVTEEYHPLAKVAKNVAAGAVVLAALFAVLTGIIIFGPYILAYF